jgi:hypothetical protein
MNRTTKRVIAAAVTVAAIGVGAGIAIAAATDDGEGTPITGPALDRASTAALAHTGEGKVTATEVGDEEGYYEVEVTLDSGKQVDVHLDRNFNVIGAESDAADDSDD